MDGIDRDIKGGGQINGGLDVEGYKLGDFLTDDAGIFYHFIPNNTAIVIQDGQVIAMERIYTP